MSSQQPAAFSPHPPKPRLALNVGVTGHRLNRLPADLAPLTAKVTEALERIAEAFERVKALPETAASHDFDQAPELRLLSPLAEGADRIAAASALRLGYQLQCPLPFPRDAYAQDFPASRDEFANLLGQANRVLELDGNRDTQGAMNLAYSRVGRFTLAHSDLLLVVWDGVVDETSVGTPGVVARAGRHGIPTVWIHAHAPHAVNFRDPELTGNAWAPLADRDLESRLRRILPPPAPRALPRSPGAEYPAHGHPAVTDGDSLRLAYFGHPEPRLSGVALGYRLFYACFGKRQLQGWRDRYQAGAVAQWATVERAAAHLPRQPLATELRDGPRDHFLWADKLASCYADEYRGTYTLMFSLASLAVLLALLSGPFQVFGAIVGATVARQLPWLAVGELLTIGWILGLWRRCHARQFQARWLDFRLLAELLRHRIILLPIGGVITLDLPDYEADIDRSHGWVRWLARAVTRVEGLPAAPAEGFNEAYRQGYTEYLAALLGDQARYHENNARRNRNIARTLHGLDRFLMVGIILACLAHIGLHVAEWLHWGHFSALGDLTVIAAAVLPAFGATAHGLFSHGEYQRIADRSEAMAARLEALVRSLREQPADSPPLSVARLEALADQAIAVMGQELTDWRVIFRAKPLEPAL